MMELTAAMASKKSGMKPMGSQSNNMYEEQPTRQKGFGLRGGFRNQANQQRPQGTGGALGAIGNLMMASMPKPKFPVPITNYMNKNKERGTQSSAVYRPMPNALNAAMVMR
jgi:hypothetical protein